MTDPVQAAEKLALICWDFISDHRVYGSLTDEQRDAIRAEAFRFSREVTPGDEWQTFHGRRLAGAVLAWGQDPSPESWKAVERASRLFEERRIS
jgi:hypothetical protein